MTLKETYDPNVLYECDPCSSTSRWGDPRRRPLGRQEEERARIEKMERYRNMANSTIRHSDYLRKRLRETENELATVTSRLQLVPVPHKLARTTAVCFALFIAFAVLLAIVCWLRFWGMPSGTIVASLQYLGIAASVEFGLVSCFLVSRAKSFSPR